MQCSVLFLVIIVVTVEVVNGKAALEDKRWLEFKAEFSKRYSTSQEENERRANFRANVQFIDQHNALYNAGLSTYRLGVNQFADMSIKEFESVLTNRVPSTNMIAATVSDIRAKPNSNIPDNLDYRTKGKVSPVMNQGQDGSVGMFAGVETVESNNAITNGNLVLLSVKQIEDCLNTSNGNSAESVFKYLLKNGGINARNVYPNNTNGVCRFDANRVAAKLSSYKILPRNENQLLTTIATEGTIVVTIDASSPEFMFYRSGIFTGNCNKNLPNHQLQVVGYGISSGIPYWILKNSWGSNWGENGYIRMERNQNLCGLANYASIPIVEKR